MNEPDTSVSFSEPPSSDAPADPEVEPGFTAVLEAEPILRTRAKVSGRSADVIIDSGSSRTLIAEHLVADSVQISKGTSRIRAIGGCLVEPLGIADAELDLHGVSLELTGCLVLKDAESPADVILGRDTLERLSLCIDIASRYVSGCYPDNSCWTVYLPLDAQQPECMVFVADVPCRASEDIEVGPGCTVAVPHTVFKPPRCSDCQISQRHLVFESQPGLEVTFVPGLVGDSQPRVLACNRSQTTVRV